MMCGPFECKKEAQWLEKWDDLFQKAVKAVNRKSRYYDTQARTDSLHKTLCGCTQNQVAPKGREMNIFMFLFKNFRVISLEFD
jgi:hypothetical protein